MTALLDVRQLEARHDQAPVVRGVSLSVGAGETVALVGPNGHGKTTLLRAISGLVRFVGGSVRLRGAELVGQPAEAIATAGITHIPQGDLVFSGMTVEDNLLMGAHPPQAWRARRESLSGVYELLPRLHERRRQYASSLSGGERRMLAIGRGLMARGALLLVDEPSLGLAPKVIEDVYALLQRLRAEGHAMVLVEENASRVTWVDRAYLLDAGRIAWSGSGAQVATSAELSSTYLGA